jgi:hypothetical protein
MKAILLVKGMDHRKIGRESNLYVRLSEEDQPWAVFEAVVTLAKTVRPFSNDFESNDLFTMNEGRYIVAHDEMSNMLLTMAITAGGVSLMSSIVTSPDSKPA